MSENNGPQVFFGGGWLGDPEATLPKCDSIDRQILEAKYEAAKAKREAEEREAREQDRYETLARLGEGRTLAEVFERAEREAVVTDRRRAAEERRRQQLADQDPGDPRDLSELAREARKKADIRAKADDVIAWARQRKADREQRMRDRLHDKRLNSGDVLGWKWGNNK